MSSITTISNSKFIIKLKRLDYYNIFLNITLILLSCAILLLVINPTKYMDSINAGIALFYYSVFPSLFPFLFISKLLDGLGAFNKLEKFFKPLTKYLFKVPSIATYPLIMTLISGYPIGVKIIGDLHKENLITSSEAKRMVTFSSTSGPIFVIGSVGASMLNNPKLGALIFISHILGSFLTAVLFNLKKQKNTTKIQQIKHGVPKNLLTNTTTSTLVSILTVAVYVSIFYMFIDMAYDLNILFLGTKIFEKILPFFNIDSQYSFGLASGLLEMTRGCKEISIIGNDFCSLLFCSGLISFGGLSIILQSLTFLSGTGVKPIYFILLKIIQLILTILVAIPIGLLFLI